MPENFEQLITDLSKALKTGETDEAEKLTRQALEQGMIPLDIVQKILVPTLTGVGQRFKILRFSCPS